MPVNNSKEKKEDVMRLQQYMAKCGVASRRASEAIICAGRVTVNGTVVTELGTKVDVQDKVCVDEKEIHLEEKKCYVLLNIDNLELIHIQHQRIFFLDKSHNLNKIVQLLV